MPSSLYKISISKHALEENINILSKYLPAFFPIIKANAYGHGLVEVAKYCLSFETAKKIAGFGVGIVSEGVTLREKGIQEDVLVLMGADPFNQEKEVLLAKEHELCLVVHDEESLRAATEADVKFVVKWNTGMNRLGFSDEEMPSVLEFLKNKKNAKVEYSFSHLALADDLTSSAQETTSSQFEKFKLYSEKIKALFPHVKTSLGQSAHVLGQWVEGKNISDIGRLGIAMYGANAFYATPWQEKAQGLKPVMTVRAPIMTVRKVEAGIGVGYGLHGKSDRNREIAVVAIGYDDGYKRIATPDRLKNHVEMQALYHGKRVNMVGNVCMQMSFFDVTGLNAKAGEEVIVMGGSGGNAVLAEELSSWWGTIPYEAMCLLGKTNNREYLD